MLSSALSEPCMVKADLVNKAAKASGVTKTQAAVAIEALFESSLGTQAGGVAT